MIELLMAAAVATMQPQDHDGHGAIAAAPAQTAMGPGPEPAETGQSAFAALGEIVAMLGADPATDWSRVDVGALRGHLVDMDNVMLRARSTTERLPDGARFRVVGGADTAGSIQRMTSGHFTPDNVRGGWTMASVPTADGAIVTVTSAQPGEVKRIQALGFFGILTLGAHHQPHHLMIARGMRH